jgi:DNA-binding MurR/RpiR family transcriptional regulator
MKKESINALSNIKKNYSSLSNVEKKIADYILQDPVRAVDITMQALSLEAGVSSGSIINFSNRMGFDGFTKLKTNIAQNLTPQNGWLFDDLAPDDSPKDVMRKMISNAAASFEATYGSISPQEFSDAAAMLAGVQRRIDVYGVGSSSMVATDAYYRLMRIGLPAYAVTDALLCSVSASMLDSSCVALGISHSGRTQETLRAMEIAKGHGAKTLCITSFAKSPLAQLCDVSIVIASRESDQHREAVVSRLTQLLVIDSLCAYIGFLHKDKSAEFIKNLIDIRL